MHFLVFLALLSPVLPFAHVLAFSAHVHLFLFGVNLSFCDTLLNDPSDPELLAIFLFYLANRSLDYFQDDGGLS